MSSKLCAAVALAFALGLCANADARPNRRPAALPHVNISQRVAFMITLHDGRVATVYTDGRVDIVPPKESPGDRKAALLRALRSKPLPRVQVQLSPVRYGSLDGDVSGALRHQIAFDLEHPPQRYLPGRVLVAFAPGVTMTRDRDELAPAAAMSLRQAIVMRRHDLSPHPFTTDARTNQTLMGLAVDGAQRLFAHVDRGTLGALRARAEARTRRPLLPFDNAFSLHVGAGSVEDAVRKLRALPGVAYAAPDFTVSPMLAQRRPVPAEALKEITGYRRAMHTFGRSTRSANAAALPALPSNTAVTFNLQAMLNAPGVDAIAGFDEIGQRFGQLPGTGEIITNVGLGDADDASAGTDPNDPCNGSVINGGPTTHLVGGQRFLDLPSLPLIPVWVSAPDGTLSPTGEVCNVDPFLAEIGLDFSVMAPLPDGAQRAGETAPPGLDLLGIAPGAAYRWVAPGATNGQIATSDTLGALIGAARQQPAPNVITASVGFGADGVGFPGRYLEDDPLVQSVVAAIVSANVVVCLSANDGTRMFTTAAIGPSGGSAPTNAGTIGTTTIGDVYFSTVPSVVPDSGAIDVGATTLDDIFSANPQDPAFAALANTKAFAETRYNGTLGFSSGFGSRVNLSAPGDNIQALYLNGPAYDSAGLEDTGGTSASAPEVAAAAAIALQVARLTNHPFTSATQVRDALIASATPVVNPPQSDVGVNVGPQVSVRRTVEQLLAAAGKAVQPGIARVAVSGRRTGAYIASFNTRYVNDGVYVTALDPSFIKLDGPFTRALQAHAVSFPGSDTGADLNSYVTIAPDWEGIPATARYRLTVAGQPARVIATTPSVRMLPAQLLAAAGIPLQQGVSRTVSLTYQASSGLHTIAESTFALTFGPPAAHSRLVFAPKVPPVVSGATIPVTYDLSGYPPELITAPVLDVSLPGIGSLFFQGVGIYPYYSLPLQGRSGTVNVPVSALAGAGTYTLWIDLNPGTTAFGSDISDLAFTRVDAGTARPPAPLLSLPGDTATSHTIQVPYKSSFVVAYDVSNVPGASGAIVEFAPPPPGFAFHPAVIPTGFNTFRNPNGNALDDDGVITGSLYHVQASGMKGTVTIDPAVAGIPVTSTVNLRVLPTNGGAPVAEASDAGTVQVHGITSALGYPLGTALLNPHGTDGVTTETGPVGPAQANTVIYTVEPFDLNARAVSGIPISFTTPNFTISPIVQNDSELLFNQVDATTTTGYIATPAAAGFSTFSFPPGSFPSTAAVIAVATNSTPTRSAYLAIDLVSRAWIATRGDVAAGSGFSAPIDVTALLPANVDYGAPTTFAYDPAADRGYLLVEDTSLACDQQSPQLITIDFSAGSSSGRTLGIGGGLTGVGNYQMSIDPATHVAAVATSCQTSTADASGLPPTRAELTLLDLTTGTTSRVFAHVLSLEQVFHGYNGTLGGDSATIGIDPVNHLIVQRSMFCPGVVGNFDLNARACLNEYDESGRLVKTIPGLFSDGFEGPLPLFNGVNGATRTGVALGQELFSIYTQSLEVQPYKY